MTPKNWIETVNFMIIIQKAGGLEKLIGKPVQMKNNLRIAKRRKKNEN